MERGASPNAQRIASAMQRARASASLYTPPPLGMARIGWQRMTALVEQHCTPLRGAQHRILPDQASAWLAQVPDWALEGDALVRTFRFADFHRTMAFVNAVAELAHREDHHPDLAVSYGTCTVRYNTHDVGGLSSNDFICAAHVDALPR